MKSNQSLLIMSVIALFFSGCSKKAPECSDEKAKEAVIQIANNKAREEGGEDLANNLTFELASIRTTGKNEDVGSFECAADLNFANQENGKTGTFQITYKTELIDDGKDFYVSVSGL